MRYKIIVPLLLIGLWLWVSGAFAQSPTAEPIITRETPPDPATVTWTTIATDLARPLFLTHAGDGSGRLFIVGQGGTIHIWRDGAILPQPFLNVTDLLTWDVNAGGYTERGLLGLAFHPNYAENGLFYINYTDKDGATVVARYSVSADNPDRADPNSALVLLRQAQPYPNHNGGHMAFGPDGYLYISLGDGGSAGDPLGAGQNTNTLLGKILRVDVDSALPYAIPPDNPFVGNGAGLPEIWAYGLRNVWRFSFDRATGDMYLADVGQNQWEEVNFQPVGVGGANYGWNAYEANAIYNGGLREADVVMPIARYDHSQGCSITGGYVYRGEAIPDLQGVYFYGDWCSGRIWALYRPVEQAWQTLEFARTDWQIASFGEDENGELYALDYGGSIYRLDPRNP